MNNDINKEIESIKENLSILPKKTKDNIKKYNEYIDDKLDIYHQHLQIVKREIETRVSFIKNKYLSSDYKFRENKLNIDDLKITNKYINNMEKMNLSIYLYQLRHFYNNDLEDINKVIDNILLAFKKCKIELTSNDFIISPAVNTYLNAILNKEKNLHELFEKLYWENPNIIYQIEVNFRYLYFKYEKTISKYYEELSSKYDSSNIINSYLNDQNYNNNIIHNNTKYICSLIINKEININDYKENNIKDIINSLVIEEDNNTYDNLLKLEETINLYAQYLNYSFIINDIKKLYNNISSFKGKYQAGLKEILKNENKLFALNKKIENKGIFKIKQDKIKELITTRNNLIEDIIKQYSELDKIAIYETVEKFINNQTSYLDILKIVCFNFSYLVNLYKDNKEDITEEEIKNEIYNLISFVYGNTSDLLLNIFIQEEKNIPLIIRDRFRLINIRVLDEDLSVDNISDFINKINRIIQYYDIKNNNIDINELEFILKVSDL